MEAHLEEWVTACDALQIKITAKAAHGPVAEFRRGEHKQHTASHNPNHVPFTREGFINACMAWIAADDQVFLIFLIFRFF